VYSIASVEEVLLPAMKSRSPVTTVERRSGKRHGESTERARPTEHHHRAQLRQSKTPHQSLEAGRRATATDPGFSPDREEVSTLAA
jgi:hypothetical protein